MDEKEAEARPLMGTIFLVRPVTRRVMHKNSKKGFRIQLKRALRTKNSTFLKGLQVLQPAGLSLPFFAS